VCIQCHTDRFLVKSLFYDAEGDEHDLHNVIRDSVKWKSQRKDNEVDFSNPDMF